MRFGLFGARADRRGLAVQGEEIARNLHPDRVLGIDMGSLATLDTDWSGFDPATLTVASLDDLDERTAAEWMDGLDVIFGCETFYRPWVTALARRMGVATVLQVNPEFAQHVYDWEPVPDVIAAPTRWRLDRLPGAVVLPVGVARDRLPRRPITRCDVILHVLGHGAAHDRNGTRQLIRALRLIRRPVGVIVRSQRPLDLSGVRGELPSCVDMEVRSGDLADYPDLYAEGDVLVMPRRYGGLHLPAQEALSVGMPVLMPDCSPNADLLPPGMLLDAEVYQPGRAFVCQAGRVELHDAEPTAMARRIEELTVRPDEVAALSDEADRIAERLSWPNVAPFYREVLVEAVRRRDDPTRRPAPAIGG